MDNNLKDNINNILKVYFNPKVYIKSQSPVGGGCISNSSILRLSNGESIFLKFNINSPSGLFKAEANGLKELYKANAIRIPKVIAFEDNKSSPSFILLEYLAPEEKKKDFFEIFARQFAKLHQTRASQHGFFEDNFIGSTKQINTQMNNWIDFFKINRLEYQINLAKTNGLWNNKMNILWTKLSPKLKTILNSSNPSLLHGDLWGGNYLIGPNGYPCLIDPAVYYGNREADLSMTTLFGGFDKVFYKAYNEAFPLEPNYKDRMEIYKLYHLLNHLNLFGSSYAGSVLSILNRFAG